MLFSRLLILLFVLLHRTILCQVTIDKKAMDDLVLKAGNSHSDALVIIVDDKIVLENYFSKTTAKIEAMSVTKSIVSLAIGRLIADGMIKSIDQPVCEFYPEWKQGKKKDITILHLLNHTSGMQNFPLTGPEINGSPDLVQLALCAELSDEPGAKFSYNNKAVNLLAGIIEKASGKKMDVYIRDVIFEPLGISDFEWRCDLAGNPHAMDGLQILPTDLAKIGQLVLKNGLWNNKQVIPAEWIERSLRPGQSLNPNCGLLWWLIPGNTTFIIDSAQIGILSAAGVNSVFLDQVSKMIGRYPTRDEYYSKLEKTLGAKWQQELDENLLPFNVSLSRKEYGYTGANANGWLGQYLVIYPEKKLIGVRMVSESETYNSQTDSFSDFEELLYKVVK